MDATYVSCNQCGYEDDNVFVAFSRTTADCDYYFCPECGAEIWEVYGL